MNSIGNLNRNYILDFNECFEFSIIKMIVTALCVLTLDKINSNYCKVSIHISKYTYKNKNV